MGYKIHTTETVFEVTHITNVFYKENGIELVKQGDEAVTPESSEFGGFVPYDNLLFFEPWDGESDGQA